MADAKGWSLRRQLFAIAAGATLATLAVGGGAMYWAAHREDAQLLDLRLADLGRTVLAFSEHEIAEIRREQRTDGVHRDAAETLGTRYHYQIWSSGGALLLRSPQASASTPMVPIERHGFADVAWNGKAYRVFAEPSADRRMVLQVAENLDSRESGLMLTSAWFLALLVLPFGAVVIVTGWLLDRSLRAVDVSAAQLGQRRALDLAPLAVDDPPAELQPMIGAINALFRRIETVLSMERGFTAAAAHELRTPLAGLRAQAQLAAVTDVPAERAEALQAVMRGVDQAAHLLEQLLDLARCESLALAPAGEAAAADLARVLAHVRAELDVEMQRRGQRLELSVAESRLPCSEAGLVLLLRNLLSNAVRYTPPGGTVALRVEAGGPGVSIRVDDSGPGIPQDQRERAFARFERLGRQDGSGVGLGMAIVQSVAAAHAATVRLLDSPLGGLRVEVMFPSAAASPPAARLTATPACR